MRPRAPFEPQAGRLVAYRPVGQPERACKIHAVDRAGNTAVVVILGGPSRKITVRLDHLTYPQGDQP